MKKMAFLLSLFIGFAATAHEGHDKSPGQIAAPHGGVVQGTSHIYLELVSQSGGIQIFPFDHEMKPVLPKDVKIEGTMTLPKKNKSEAVKFSQDGEGFVSKIDAKGTHRYTLDVLVTHEGKKEKVKFNVEPQ